MEQDEKQCPYCGETIKKNAKKCRFCGRWLDDEPLTIDMEHNITSESEDTETEKSLWHKMIDGRKPQIIIWVVTLVVLFWAGYGLYVMMRGKAEPLLRSEECWKDLVESNGVVTLYRTFGSHGKYEEYVVSLDTDGDVWLASRIKGTWKIEEATAGYRVRGVDPGLEVVTVYYDLNTLALYGEHNISFEDYLSISTSANERYAEQNKEYDDAHSVGKIHYVFMVDQSGLRGSKLEDGKLYNGGEAVLEATEKGTLKYLRSFFDK